MLDLSQVVVPPSLIVPEVTDSIVNNLRAHGMLRPLIVRPDGKGRYDLLAGVEWFVGCRHLGISPVPALVREKATDHDELLQLALAVDSAPLTTYEFAERLHAEHTLSGRTVSELADATNMEAQRIEHLIRLFESLSPRLRDHWRHGGNAIRLSDLEGYLHLRPDEQDEAFARQYNWEKAVEHWRYTRKPTRVPARSARNVVKVRTVAEIKSMIERLPRAYLTLHEQTLVRDVAQWIMGLRSHLPFRVAQTAKFEQRRLAASARDDVLTDEPMDKGEHPTVPEIEDKP